MQNMTRSVCKVDSKLLHYAILYTIQYKQFVLFVRLICLQAGRVDRHSRDRLLVKQFSIIIYGNLNLSHPCIALCVFQKSLFSIICGATQ